MSHEAPLSEVLAAAIVKATNWNPDENFVNPMCGSGTLAIEAALAGTQTPSQILRSNFGFMHSRWYDAAQWNSIRAAALKNVRTTVAHPIVATDLSASAVQATRKNARTAGMLDFMDVQLGDFRRTNVPEGDGVVVLNPEYGERMGTAKNLDELYEQIGDWFKQHCEGKRAYVFTGNLDLGKRVGLRPSRKIPFFNADIECRLYEYIMYRGTKRALKDDSTPDTMVVDSDKD
jgi:putative N6-adenine-specific DNA methylase